MVLFNPGEVSADGYEGYLTNDTLTGVYAQEIQGAVILIERECHCYHGKKHSLIDPNLDRYWGDSSPYEVLNAETLQYLTLDQSILDMTYFAETVKLQFDNSSRSNAQNAVCYLHRSMFLIGTDNVALGHGRWLIQRCLDGLDRVYRAWNVLGLPCHQCACGGYL